jgi:flagellar motor switch protein FliG
MGVYTRFKRGPEGFRALVELLESTPASRRQMKEDPDYTQEAMLFVLTFEDIIKLPDLELAEVLAKTPARTVALAIRQSADEVKQRFLRNAKPQVAAEIKDYMTVEAGLRETGGAQLKLIEVARQLERRGLVKTKHIPTGKEGI